MNTNIKRLLLVTSALVMILAGCGTTSKTTAPPPQPAPVAAPEPAPPPPPPPPPPEPAPAPTYVIESDVLFDFDKSTLKPAAIDTLDRVANELRQQPGVRYEVAGFTDSVGSVAYNQGLSERRAEAVRSYLVSRGVSAGQLTTRGYSESNPVASNATAAGRSMNRRVEIRPIK